MQGTMYKCAHVSAAVAMFFLSCSFCLLNGKNEIKSATQQLSELNPQQASETPTRSYDSKITPQVNISSARVCVVKNVFTLTDVFV